MNTNITTDTTNNTLIVYHGPSCNDGFTSAWVTYNAVKENSDDVHLYPINYSDDLVKKLIEYISVDRNTYSYIYIVDFSLKVDVLERLTEITTASIVILDHHKSAFENYGYPVEHLDSTSSLNLTLFNFQVEILLDNFKSGAGICWEFFHPKVRPPLLVFYVQDRDLWTFYSSHTKAIHMYLNSRERTMESWDDIAKVLDSYESNETAIVLGNKLLEKHNEIVANIVKASECCTINGESGLMALCDFQYTSDVGHELALRSKTYGLTYQANKEKKDSWICSLRSNGDYDVQKIAKVMGGGGHKNAAGFECSLKALRSFAHRA